VQSVDRVVLRLERASSLDVLALNDARALGTLSSDRRGDALHRELESADLERMGDLARHIAKVARMRYPECAVPEELCATFERKGEIGADLAGKVARVARESACPTNPAISTKVWPTESRLVIGVAHLSPLPQFAPSPPTLPALTLESVRANREATRQLPA